MRLTDKGYSPISSEILNPASPPPAPPTRVRRPAPPTREQIALLPPFEGLPLAAITVVRTAAEAEHAGAALRAAGTVGFDTESRPTFRKDQVNTGPHLLQFATLHAAWLFQTGQADILPVAAALLADPQLTKVGFGLGNDRALIHSRLGVEPAGLIDLDGEFRRRGYKQSIGVKTGIALMFGQCFTKSRKATTSNWASRTLTEAQMRYAANDAYGALRVHEALMHNASPAQ